MLPDLVFPQAMPALKEWGLNAPDGARCSLTWTRACWGLWWSWRLNAPDGAGCSLTYVAPQVSADFVAKSQCTWWCWVLPDAISLSATVSAIIGGP